MTLGYDGKLYILAFDHRGSFQKKFFGIDGEPDPEQTAIIADAKHLIFEGLLRPQLMLRAIAAIQAAGIEVDVWKIEGVEQRSDCEALVAQARSGGRGGVACVVLGRGADENKVDHWLAQAAPVEGFVGFAIGRSIWWDPLKAYVDGKIERAAGARKIAENYLRFVKVYEAAEGKAPVAT